MNERMWMVSLVCTGLLAGGVHGSVIVESVIPGDEITGGIPFTGQSILTPAAPEGPWDQLTFNFYTSFKYSDFTPYAIGAIYLLDQSFAGYPADLSPSTPGYLAHTSATQAEDGGLEWVFDPVVQIEPAQQYYFFQDTQPTTLMSYQPDNYPDGNYFDATPSGIYYDRNPYDVAFQLEGNNQGIPEPSVLALLLIGLLPAIRRFGSGRSA